MYQDRIVLRPGRPGAKIAGCKFPKWGPGVSCFAKLYNMGLLDVY